MNFFTRNTEYIDDGTPIRHLSGESLTRSFNVPWSMRLLMVAFVVAAAIIGTIFLTGFFDETINGPKREAESTQENLAKEVVYGTPVLHTIITLPDEEIIPTLTNAGFTMYDLNALNQEGAGVDVIRLPETVSLVDATVLYAKGVSNLSSSEAARLLNGSWRLSVSGSGYTDMNARYADFVSKTPEKAIQAALAQQGLTETTMGEAGVDSAGNTYQTGQIGINDTVYNWRISVCPLSEVYSTPGLPEDALYVGIRMYQ